MKPSRPPIDFPTYEKESSATAVDQSPWFDEKPAAPAPAPRPAAGEAPRPGPSVPRPAPKGSVPAKALAALAPKAHAKHDDAAPLDLRKRLPTGYALSNANAGASASPPVQTKTAPLQTVQVARTTTQPLVLPARAPRRTGAPSFGPDAPDPGSVAMIRNINGELTAPPVVHAPPPAVVPPPLPAWAAAPPVVHAPRPVDPPAAAVVAPAWSLPGLPAGSAAADRKELPSFGPVAFDLDDHRNAPTTMIRPERARTSFALAGAAAGLLLLVVAGKLLAAHLASDDGPSIAAAVAAPPEAPTVVATPMPETPALPRLTPEEIFPAATATTSAAPAKIPAATYRIEKAHMGADLARRNAPVLPFSTRPTLRRDTPSVDDLLRTPPVRGEHD